MLHTHWLHARRFLKASLGQQEEVLHAWPAFARVGLPRRLKVFVDELQQENASEQAVSTCSLALAMLSSFSRVPDLAFSQDLLEKVPLLVKACPEQPTCVISLLRDTCWCAAETVGNERPLGRSKLCREGGLTAWWPLACPP